MSLCEQGHVQLAPLQIPLQTFLGVRHAFLPRDNMLSYFKTLNVGPAANLSELALTFTRVAVSWESIQLVISSLARRNISFFVVSQDLKHFSMSVKLDLNLNQCHETNNGENY